MNCGNCEKCGQPHKYLFYKQNNAAMFIIKVCNKYLPNMNNDIINHMIRFTDYYCWYKVCVKKNVIKEEENNSVEEKMVDSFLGIHNGKFKMTNYEVINLCRRCIVRSMIYCHKYFKLIWPMPINQKHFKINIIVHEEEIQKVLTKVVLPQFYICLSNLRFKQQTPLDLIYDDDENNGDNTSLIIIKQH